MTTMPKSAGTSEALRSSTRIAVPEGNQALVNAAEAWFAATTECQREMIGFVSLRLEKDAATTREIMGCQNLADVAAVHSRWMEETLRDYSSEMGKLTTICTRSANGGSGPKG
ncbi:phasin family protein [Microvirga sp. 2MCAF35]|uniref:phasin family protein n=1 Tax=Microvirga sp. 2MCAF35 TaxID=3232987 RepID=UPI003F978237